MCSKRTLVISSKLSFLLFLRLLCRFLDSLLGCCCLLLEIDEHGWIEHLFRDPKTSFARVCKPCRHHKEWVHHQHILPATTVLVGTIHSCALVSKLARYVRMYVETLVAVCAFWEKFALFSWVVILTLFCGEVTFGPVFTTDLAFVSGWLG